MEYCYFEPNETIDERIQSNDVEALRGILVGIINRDPTFATKRYDEAWDYIVKRGLVEIYDARGKVKISSEFETDVWNKDYFRKLLSWLSQNYTEERVEYIKKVGKKVYCNEYTQGKDEAENFSRPVTLNQRSTQKSRSATGKTRILIILLVVIVAIWLIISLMKRNNQNDLQTQTETVQSLEIIENLYQQEESQIVETDNPMEIEKLNLI